MKINVMGAVAGAIAFGALAGACLPAGSEGDTKAENAHTAKRKQHLAATRPQEPQRLSVADTSGPLGR